MEIITRTIKYSWTKRVNGIAIGGNKLSLDDKAKILSLYLQGYAVYNIANAFNVTPTTIQYQLEVMGVYVKNSKPSIRNQLISINRPTYSQKTLIQPHKQQTVPLHILTINQKFIKEDAQERIYEHTKPSMYAEIQRKQNKIRKTFKPNYLVPIPIAHSGGNFKPIITITL